MLDVQRRQCRIGRLFASVVVAAVEHQSSTCTFKCRQVHRVLQLENAAKFHAGEHQGQQNWKTQREFDGCGARGGTSNGGTSNGATCQCSYLMRTAGRLSAICSNACCSCAAVGAFVKRAVPRSAAPAIAESGAPELAWPPKAIVSTTVCTLLQRLPANDGMFVLPLVATPSVNRITVRSAVVRAR